MVNTTSIIRPYPLSMSVYEMVLTCDFGALDEGIVSYLTILNWIALDNYPYSSFVGGRIKRDIS